MGYRYTYPASGVKERASCTPVWISSRAFGYHADEPAAWVVGPDDLTGDSRMPQAGRVGDQALNPADAHGCPACDHVVEGPAKQGSPDVFVNSRAVLRVGDPGVHSACCGSNTWQAREGSSGVFVNGKRLHRLGDATEHCGGEGALVEGSPNVFIGDLGPGAAKEVPHDRSVTLELKDAMGRVVQEAIARAKCPHKNYEEVKFSGRTTISGLCSGATVSIVKALQKGEWDAGTSSGHVISPSHAIVEK